MKNAEKCWKRPIHQKRMSKLTQIKEKKIIIKTYLFELKTQI